jgi:biotin carboxylase
MGVLDLILDNEDRYVFLEVNTQGQFLFAEHLAGVDLTEHCARYLAQVVPVST